MIKKILGVITSLVVVGAIVMVVLEYKGYSSMLPQGQSAQTTTTTATTTTTTATAEEQQVEQEAEQTTEETAKQKAEAQAEENLNNEQTTPEE